MLCEAYWFPLYAYVRRRGYGPHDAEDLTQGFFARLLRLNSLSAVRPDGGRFRAYLLTALKHYLWDQHAYATAAKRSARQTIPLDPEKAEQRYAIEVLHSLSPEQLFERQWALALLENVLQTLRAEYETAGRGNWFAALRFAITGERNALPYEQLAVDLDTSVENVKVAVHRLRQRYRRALRSEIGRTVGNDAEVNEELRALRKILS